MFSSSVKRLSRDLLKLLILVKDRQQSIRLDLTPDVWAQIGWKSVLFRSIGLETEYLYMGVFLEGVHLYGCVSREFTSIWVCF